VISLQPGHPKAHYLSAKAVLARTHLKQEDYQQAIAFLQAAVKGGAGLEARNLLETVLKDRKSEKQQMQKLYQGMFTPVD
jgi:hypothetical protein